MPRFSVIVPVYNVLPYLSQCVESIIKQSFQDYELILVDDGSTDGSGELCDEFAHKYEKIRVIHKENGGLVSARKAGLLEAAGEYIVSVDSDDYIDVNLLSEIDRIIVKYQPDVIAFDLSLVTETGEFLLISRNEEEEGFYTGEKLTKFKERLIFDKELRRYNSGNISNNICAKIFKKECLLLYQMAVPNEIREGEDMAVSMPVLYTCQSAYVFHFAGYFYRQRASSIVHSFDYDELRRRELLASHLINHIPGVDEERISLRAFAAIMEYIQKALVFEKSYSKFRDIMRLPQNKAYMQRMQTIDDKHYTFKHRVDLFCLNHELWLVFWTVKRFKQIVKGIINRRK